MSFKNWHKELGQSWPEHSKVSKNFTLAGSFCTKYILFELKQYREVIFHETELGYRIWRGINLFKNWHKEFDKFWPEHSKVSKIVTLMGSFWAKYILFELKNEFSSYLSWKWRGILHLEKNRLVISKLTYIYIYIYMYIYI